MAPCRNTLVDDGTVVDERMALPAPLHRMRSAHHAVALQTGGQRQIVESSQPVQPLQLVLHQRGSGMHSRTTRQQGEDLTSQATRRVGPATGR